MNLKGTVRKYLSYRGFGFIEYDESEKDIFFHSSNFQASEVPKENQEVEFRVIDTPKGKEAIEVKLVQPQTIQSEGEENELAPLDAKVLNELDGIGPKYLELLKATGIKSVNSLMELNAEKLYASLLDTNESMGITKRPPTLSNVEKWIEAAGSRR
jgi:cold shock CspA family protein